MRVSGALRAIGVLGLFQVGVMLANLVRIKVVAVEGGPAQLGLLSVIDQIVQLVALGCTFSLPFAAVKFLSFAHSRTRQSFARSYAAFRRSLLALSIVGLAAAVTIAVARPGVFGAEVARHRDALLIALAAIPIFNLLTLLTRAVAAAGRPRASAAITLAQWTVVAVCASVGLLVDGLRGYFVGSVVAMALVLVGGSVYLRRRERTNDRGGPVRTIGELRLYPGVLRFALVQSVLTLTTPLAYLVARYAVLDGGGLAAAGFLAAAFGVSQALTGLLMPANALFLTPALNRDDPPAVKHERMLQFRGAIMLALAAAMLPLLLFPEAVLAVLFAPEFATASSFVYLFVIAEAFVIVSAVNQALLIGLDDFAINVVFVLIGQAVMVVLVLVLVPAVGVAGVGVALIATHALILGLTTRRLWRRHGMATLRGVPPSVPAAFLAMVAVGAAAPALPAADLTIVAAKVALLVGALALGWLLVARRRAAGMVAHEGR